MKRLLLLTILFTSSFVNAQHFYISLGSGYNLPLASQTMDNLNFQNTHYNSVTPGQSSIEQIYVSLGSGFSSSATLGYRLDSGIAFEFFGTYTIGKGYYSNQNWHNYSLEQDAYLIIDQTLQSDSWMFGPSVKYTIPLNRVNLYAGCQLVLLKARIMYSIDYQPQPGYQGSWNWQDQNHEYFGGVGIGGGASFGASYSIGDHWQLFGEARMSSVSYKPTKGIITFYGFDGVNEVDQLSYWGRNIEFLDLKEPQEYPIDESQPQQRVRTSYPFSSTGVQLGVSFEIP